MGEWVEILFRVLCMHSFQIFCPLDFFLLEVIVIVITLSKYDLVIELSLSKSSSYQVPTTASFYLPQNRFGRNCFDVILIVNSSPILEF